MSEQRPAFPASRARTATERVARLVLWLLVCCAFIEVFWKYKPLIGFFGGTVAFYLAVTYFVNRFRYRQFQSEMYSVIATAGRGEFDQARAVYSRWAEYTALPRSAALAAHGVGWTLLRQGKLEQAIEVLRAAMKNRKGPLIAIGLFRTAAVDLALCHALRGEVEATKAAMVNALPDKNGASLPTLPPTEAFVQAVLDCRMARCDEAARLLNQRWAECEAALTGDVLRPLRVLRAYAVATSDPRAVGMAEALLVTARPAYPGEYDFLGIAWPEMATFLTTHKLARQTTAPAPNGAAVREGSGEQSALTS